MILRKRRLNVATITDVDTERRRRVAAALGTRNQTRRPARALIVFQTLVIIRRRVFFPSRARPRHLKGSLRVSRAGRARLGERS